MARLFEYQGKELLRAAGLSVPRGRVADSPAEARAAAEEIGGPVVLKAQVWSTGRFKAGGIRFARDPGETESLAAGLLGSEVKGFRVERVLVEERLDIEREFYAGVIVDSSHRVRAPVVLFSDEGGVDVEGVGERNLSRAVVDVFAGLTPEQARGLVRNLGVGDEQVEPLARALRVLYGVFRDRDARSAEINPLVRTRDGRIVAADCRLSLDDASVGRHPDLGIVVPRESSTAPTPLDLVGWKIEEKDYRGSSFFAQWAEDTSRGGYIAYHAIGGGGALLAADLLVREGLNLANYAETSGNPTAAKVYRTARVVLSQPGLEGYCLLGAVIASQDQWHHAHGLVKAFDETLRDRPGFPVVVLIAGNKEEEALEILREGLAALPVRVALYGRSSIHDLRSVTGRMRELVEAYRAESPRARPPAPAAPAPALPGGKITRHRFVTGTIRIAEALCEGCETLACVKACSLYGGYLFRVRNGKRVLGIPEEDVPRRCTECCACEFECRRRGRNALAIHLPVEGLTDGHPVA